MKHYVIHREITTKRGVIVSYYSGAAPSLWVSDMAEASKYDTLLKASDHMAAVRTLFAQKNTTFVLRWIEK